ncbi:MAG: hypothetical protein IJ524_05875 [Bacteroidales bacterium]|nr:hypothetical protein [Bacteroidales bacterium]
MKKLLFISILELIPLFVYAQYTTVVTEKIGACFPDLSTTYAVRNCTRRNITVTYTYGPSGKAAFCAMKYDDYTSGAPTPSFPLFCVPLPAQLKGIGDFRIIGDYVCFGGPSATLYPPHFTTDFFGFFKLSELMSGTTVNFKLMQIDDFVIEKIEGFKDDHGFKVFALGYYFFKQNLVDTNDYYAILEVDDPPTASGYTIKHDPISQQNPGNGFFDDIVILDDKVVFVGSHLLTTPPSPPYPCWGPIKMRWVDKALGINDPQLDFIYYQTATGPLPEDERNSRIQAKPIDGQTFVIGYTNTELSTGVSTRRVRVFDSNMDNIVSQEYPIYNKLGMYEMVYNRKGETLTVLEPDGITSRFVFTHPLNTTPYAALTLQDANNYHHYLDTISGHQFISTQEDRWTFQVADQVSYISGVNTNNCINHSGLEVDIIPHLKKTSLPNNLILEMPISIVVYPIGNVISCTLPVICVSK